MSAPSPREREQRLEKVLADYLNLEEAGQAASKEELLAAHPDLEEELRSFFRNRDAIRRLAVPLQQGPSLEETVGPAGAAEAGEVVRYFGDYELMGEIARG